MMRQERASSGIIARTGVVAAALLLTGAAAASGADLRVQAADATAAAGGNGSFDIVLTDTSSTASYQVGSFQVQPVVGSSSGVTFTGVTPSPTSAGYIFGGYQSGDPSTFSVDAFPNTTFAAFDSDGTAPGYVTLAPGQTVGLARVAYSVAAGTGAGSVDVSFDPDNTLVADAGAAALARDLSDGTITVTSTAAVPEPATLGLAGAAGLLCLRRRR